MKYLITGIPDKPLPPEQIVATWKAAREWVNARLSDGSLDCHYLFPDKGGFVIANAESHEAAWQLLMEYPLQPYMDWEAKALCDWSYMYDTIIEVVQQQAGES